MKTWTPDSWQGLPDAQAIAYPDLSALEDAVRTLRAYPPLVAASEVERLRAQLAEAEAGKRFLLLGGDCAAQARLSRRSLRGDERQAASSDALWPCPTDPTGARPRLAVSSTTKSGRFFTSS